MRQFLSELHPQCRTFAEFLIIKKPEWVPYFLKVPCNKLNHYTLEVKIPSIHPVNSNPLVVAMDWTKEICVSIKFPEFDRPQSVDLFDLIDARDSITGIFNPLTPWENRDTIFQNAIDLASSYLEEKLLWYIYHTECNAHGGGTCGLHSSNTAMERHLGQIFHLENTAKTISFRSSRGTFDCDVPLEPK